MKKRLAGWIGGALVALALLICVPLLADDLLGNYGLPETGLSLGGGIMLGDITMSDDTCVEWGNTAANPDYEACFDSVNSWWEFVTTDSDGGGTDADLIRVLAGDTEITVLGDVDLSTNDLVNPTNIYSEAPTTDVAPASVLLHSGACYSQGTQTASDLVFAGGLDEKFFTSTDFANSTDDTLTITINGAGTTLTESIDWDCDVTSDIVCACALYTAIIGTPIAGVTPGRLDGTCSDARVYIIPTDATTYSLALVATDAGGGGVWGVATNGTDGTVEINSVLSADGEIVIGANLDINGAYVYDSGDQVDIGGACTDGHTQTTGACIDGELQVDGLGYFDSSVYFYARATWLYSTTEYLRLQPNVADDAVHITANNTSGTANASIALVPWIYSNDDFDHDADNNIPTFYIHSIEDPDTNNAEWVGFRHDTIGPRFMSGQGRYAFEDDSGFGAMTMIAHKSETVTFPGGGAASQVTVGSIIPDGAFLIGVSSRVSVAGGNCTGYSLGDTVIVDMWGADIAVTENTTSANTNIESNWANPHIDLQEITVTGTNGAGVPANCTNLEVKLKAHYLDISADTSH